MMREVKEEKNRLTRHSAKSVLTLGLADWFMTESRTVFSLERIE